jgi:peptidoglycan/LPS O-acetylase OafA/YrhL
MNEIKTLTGLRGVAAITVMLGHFLNDDAYFRDYLPSLVKRSYLGVDVFFILSGFVLALRYGDKFRESFSFAALKNFLIKRFARIYPLYFVITIIFSMKYLYNFSGDSVFRGYHLPDFIACLLMIQAWGFGFFCVAGATWSLSTECFAYLIFPALAFLTLNRAVYALIMLSASIILVTLVATSPLGVTGKMDVVASSSSLILPGSFDLSHLPIGRS